MSQEAVERLLGRLITDDGFRARARQGLLRICREEGYALTPGELGLLARLDLGALEGIAELVDTGLRRG